MRKLLTVMLIILIVALMFATKGFTQLPPTWWANSFYMETYQNGLGFGGGTILDGRTSKLKYEGERLDDGDNDIYFQEDFEDASVSFTCGANLTPSEEIAAPLSKTKSILITQSAGAQGQNCQSPSIALDEKQKGSLNQICMVAEGENFDLIAYDVTNSNELGRLNFKNKDSYCLEFLTLATTNEIAYRLEAAIEEVSSTLKFDDIKLKTNPLSATEIYASKGWTQYTPTSGLTGWTGSIEGRWKRDGENLKVRIWHRFTGGAFTGGAPSYTLPDNLQIDTKNNPFDGTTSDLLKYGTATLYDTSAVGANGYFGEVFYDNPSRVLVRYVFNTNGNNYPATSFLINTTTPFLWTTNDSIFLEFEVPILGWSDKSNGVVVKNKSNSASVENIFNAAIDSTSTCNVINQVPQNWLTCSILTTNQCTCAVDGSIFTTLPALNCESEQSGEAICDIRSGLTFRSIVQNANGTANVSAGVEITATKKPQDYVKETERVNTVPIGFKESKSYETGIVSTFWDTTGNTSLWDASLLDLSQDENIEIVDNFPTFLGTSTVIRAKNPVDIAVSVYGPMASGGQGIIIYKNINTKQLAYQVTDGAGYPNANATTRLNTGEILIFQASSLAQREGLLSIWVKSANEDGLWVGRFGQPSCYVSHTGADGTKGGTATTLSWNTLTLNEITGSCSFMSLASNVLTIKKGTYEVDCHKEFYDVVYANIKLRNTTDGVTAANSLAPSYCPNGTISCTSRILRKFTINDQKDFELQYYVNNNGGLNEALGLSQVDGEPEIFHTCKFTKVR